jgi:hypothetical protein
MTASAVQQLVTDAHVPGLSMAVIGDRQATALIVVGVRNSLDRAAVDQQTIFAAASLSKPLFAYAPTGRYRQARVRHTPVAACAGLCCRRSKGGCRHGTARSEPLIGSAQLALCRSSTQDVLPTGRAFQLFRRGFRLAPARR